ncbi:phage major capsid protein [Amycolatopsis sp. NPDC004368]
MPYNNATTRADAQALMPEEVSKAMLGKLTQDSATLAMFRRIPVARDAVRFPIISALPVAYWVAGDTGLKQTTKMAWDNKFLHIEEIATILPVPENVADDIDGDVWDSAEPLIREAIGMTLDSAVFFGINAPSSFPTNVLDAATAAGNVVTEGTANAAAGGYFGDIDNLIGDVEEDGYDVDGYVAARSARRKFRAARDTQGRKNDPGRLSADLKELDGVPISYPMRGMWAANGGAGTNVRLFAGQWDQFVVGVRQDIEMKLLTEAVIQDNTGAIVYNLPQQDMIAYRLKFRVGWQVANTINNDNPDEATRYPVAALKF